MFSVTQLESIALSSSLVQFQYLYDSVKNLKRVDLPIGRMDVSHKGHEEFSKLTVYASAKKICYSPVYSCFGLEEVVFEDNCQLERIGPKAFQNTKL